jgi:hypothetical protein
LCRRPASEAEPAKDWSTGKQTRAIIQNILKFLKKTANFSYGKLILSLLDTEFAPENGFYKK